MSLLTTGGEKEGGAFPDPAAPDPTLVIGFGANEFTHFCPDGVVFFPRVLLV